MFIEVLLNNFYLNRQLLVWYESTLGSSGFNEMFLINADTYIPSKYTQDLWCSFFICQSHLALINEKTFNVHFHLMTMIKIVSYMPVE